MKPKVLFITPETQRAGAPLQLLNFISWLVEKDLVQPIIFLHWKGSIDDDFKKLGKVFYYYEPKKSTAAGMLTKIQNRIANSGYGKKKYMRELQEKIAAEKPDLIYSNTIVNGDLLEFCKNLSAKVITHVHESSYLFGLYGEENMDKVIRYSSNYIACSDHVQRCLLKLNIPQEKIVVVHSSVSSDAAEKKQDAVADEKITAAVKAGKKFIGGSGGLGWLKGSDLIIPLMKELLKSERDMCFLWVGGNPSAIEYSHAMMDIKNAGLEAHVIITGSVTNPLAYFSLLKVFVLLSREDSFPLVCLENAMLSNPVVCFAESGGAAELLKDWPTNILPYLDTNKMAERIIEMINDQELSKNIGSSLRNTVLQQFTSGKLFPEIFKIMQGNMQAAKN